MEDSTRKNGGAASRGVKRITGILGRGTSGLTSRFRLFSKSSDKTGLPPGAMIFVGEPRTERVTMERIRYSADHVERTVVERPEDVPADTAQGVNTWVNVRGVHDADMINRMGLAMGLHPLVMEDIVNTGLRPNAEVSGEHLFVVTRMLTVDPQDGTLHAEQVSMVLGKNFVVTFQESDRDLFGNVAARIEKGGARIRGGGPDYLAYAILDTVVDHYFLIIENIGEALEDLDAQMDMDPDEEILHRIRTLKRDLVLLRKTMWPHRELLRNLHRNEMPLISTDTRVFLADVYQHVLEITDTLEVFRDMLGSMLDLYLSGVSNRMNEVMKVLTVIATIFIPLTFITGVYGMNFRHIPELSLPWAYPVFWVVILGISGTMLYFFRKKKWL